MQPTIFENVKSEESDQVKAFVASIENSVYHWHMEHEFICVLEGNVTVMLQSGERILAPGDLLWINSREIHSIHSQIDENNLCMLIQIDPQLLMANQKDAKEIRFYLDSASDEIPRCGYRHFYQRAARIIYETMSEDLHAVFRRRAETYGLIADLFDNVIYETRIINSKNQKDHELTVAIIDYIEKNISNEKDTEIVSRKFGISRKTLERNLRATVGCSSRHIINEIRVDLATELLKQTNHNMNYILDTCGFGSEKTFYRIFHESTGVTPGEFRKRGQLFSDDRLKGYLDFETPRVKALLEQIIAENPETANRN